jgi:AraC family transcriptional regulator
MIPSMAGPDVLRILNRIRARGEGNVPLDRIARLAGWSPFHLHRAFRAVVGETPKQYQLRLQLERAAVALACTADSVLDVALASGFAGHEVFSRAFRRHFGTTPSRYRQHALAGESPQRRRHHRAMVEATGPCLTLYHMATSEPRRVPMPTLSIARQELAAQPILFVRMRAARHELATAIGQGLGKAYPLALSSGAAVVGRPFTRYLSAGPGLLKIEVGMPVSEAAAGQGDVEAGSLPGGPVAVALHSGSYEQLSETYAALERWIEENGHTAAGAPWESYITDPTEHPDPADWRTEVCWPIR